MEDLQRGQATSNGSSEPSVVAHDQSSSEAR
jgi:hypothetical protein